jgi:hypothetical protein
MLTKIPPQWRLTFYQLVKLLSAVALGAGVVSQQQAETISTAVITLVLGSLAAANTPSNPGAKPELPQAGDRSVINAGPGKPPENMPANIPPPVTYLIQRAPAALDAMAQVRAAIEKAAADGEAQTRRITDELGRVLRVQVTPEPPR